jgi:hypothetical protein
MQEGLAAELERIEARQRHLMTEVESRIGRDAESLNGEIDQQKQLLARLRESCEVGKRGVAGRTAEVEAHAAERGARCTRSPTGCGSARRPARLIDREGSEAAQRIQIALGDIERRQVEQLQRVVDRAAARYSEAAQQQFDTTIRTAREEAPAAEPRARPRRRAVRARGRDRAHRAPEPDRRRRRGARRGALSRLRGNLERQRDDALRSLEERAHTVEASLRERLREIASDAEAERAVIEARLLELTRRIEEQAART